MAKQLQIRGGTTEQHNTFTGALREITIDTSKNTVVVHDGSTPGGSPLAKESSVNTGLASKVDKNTYIVAGTGTKITYDTKGLVTGSTTLGTADIPNLDAGKITTGTLPVVRGGTGVTSSTGSGSVVLSGSPTFTGTPTAPTQSAGDNSTKVATTAYVASAVSVVAGTNLGITAGTTNGPIITSSTGTDVTLPTASSVTSGVVTTGTQTIAGAKTFSINPLSSATQSTNADALTKYSAVVKNTGDETIAGTKTFSTSPVVPTPTAGDNSTKVATTAYVDDKMVRGTAVTASGTSIDFTGIPFWVKRITVMFNGVSTNGSSPICIRLGNSGGIESTGYVGVAGCGTSAGYMYNSTTEFPLTAVGTYNAAHNINGNVEISNINSNAWTLSGNIVSAAVYAMSLAGSKTLSARLDRIRITTVNGTDVFDAGSINIMYQG